MAEINATEQRAISILEKKLAEAKDKLIEVPLPIQSFFQRILEKVKTKNNTTFQTISSLKETIEEPKGSTQDPFSQLGGLFSSLIGGSGNNSFMEIVNKTINDMQKFSVNKDDIDFWRTTPELLQVLELDPRARYMYLAPTPLLPSLSGLYLEFSFESQSIYVLFASQQENPLVYTENILTREFVEKIFQDESSKLDPMLRMIVTPHISQYLDIDNYWTFINPELNPTTRYDKVVSTAESPVQSATARRRPVYVEES